MSAVYKVSSSVKVKQMEAELWSHLSALKVEIEENGGAGSSNAYRFVCDVIYYLSSDCQKGGPESYPQLKIWLFVILHEFLPFTMQTNVLTCSNNPAHDFRFLF